MVTVAMGLAAAAPRATAAPAPTTVTVRVDGEAQVSAEMLNKLKERGAKRGTTIVESATDYDIRLLVIARPPQWHQAFGVSASGAVAVLGPDGSLLFTHLRQKESSVGRAMDRMADEILDRLPVLIRGENVQ
jgi:hypothetical protein